MVDFFKRLDIVVSWIIKIFELIHIISHPSYYIRNHISWFEADNLACFTYAHLVVSEVLQMLDIPLWVNVKVFPNPDKPEKCLK